jgi:hypothetical protein
MATYGSGVEPEWAVTATGFPAGLQAEFVLLADGEDIGACRYGRDNTEHGQAGSELEHGVDLQNAVLRTIESK